MYQYFHKKNRYPDFETLKIITSKFDVSLDWLMEININDNSISLSNDLCKSLNSITNAIDSNSTMYKGRF